MGSARHIAASRQRRGALALHVADIQGRSPTAHVSEAAALRCVGGRPPQAREPPGSETCSPQSSAPGSPPLSASGARTVSSRCAQRAMVRASHASVHEQSCGPASPRAWPAGPSGRCHLLSGRIFFDAGRMVCERNAIQALLRQPGEHFCAVRRQEGRALGRLFSSRRYLDDNHDVARKGVNLAVHFLRSGRPRGTQIRRGTELIMTVTVDIHRHALLSTCGRSRQSTRPSPAS